MTSRSAFTKGGKEIIWYECDIVDCFKIASHQNAITGRMVCKGHYEELALVPHQTGFVKITKTKKA